MARAEKPVRPVPPLEEGDPCACRPAVEGNPAQTCLMHYGAQPKPKNNPNRKKGNRKR